jgi:Dihydrodipicolinate reductase, C-terminus
MSCDTVKSSASCLLGHEGIDLLTSIILREVVGVGSALTRLCLPQVVAFQATMELMAETFPGAFSGYTLRVVESHQRTKADTSGTAKAVVASLQKLGVKPFKEVIRRRINPRVPAVPWKPRPDDSCGRAVVLRSIIAIHFPTKMVCLWRSLTSRECGIVRRSSST